jgi:hypothetical protein
MNFRYPEVVAELKKRLADWEAEMDAEEKEVLVR